MLNTIVYFSTDSEPPKLLAKPLIVVVPSNNKSYSPGDATLTASNFKSWQIYVRSLPPSTIMMLPVAKVFFMQYKYASESSSGVPTVFVSDSCLKWSSSAGNLSCGMSENSSV